MEVRHVALADAIAGAYERLGSGETSFECCDTHFTVSATGRGADRAVEAARETARSLERELDAFDDASAVAEINATGRVSNPHVARIVTRGLEYAERTDGRFDIRRGEFEHDLKAYLHGDTEDPPRVPSTDAHNEISVSGEVVTADRPLDLNGLAKGYIVDRAREALDGVGRTGVVSGGGDIARPHGPIAVESPFGDSRPLVVLDTRWNVASSAGYNRRRGDLDHIYDPVSGRIGTRHDQVTVVARRDCMEADALATTLSALPLSEALALGNDWPDAEALVVTGGVFHRTEGFDEHLA